ncbi:uncharacterized protein LOC112560292 isoform X1 [Pomacea canaliculata]|uniref:uncharacterized protein LOC112560292 isoform X1 n=1 Tax=Pomacea canaliculata TaxID=400727 RepID=UPI000D72E512|nr:uncharacterized protein LOC112560292 isoform X1 [Pomacea canaliculata]
MKMLLFRFSHSESVRPKMSVFFWTLWLMIQYPRIANAVCSSYAGPAGSYDCYLSSHYTGYQWGTCVTDDYLTQKSKGMYACRDWTTYCYFQCMLELHGVLSGNVTADCACDPQQSTVSPNSYHTTLSPKCYSPSGTDCSWYSNCLEKKFPCASGSDDYGIAYGEKFCNAYSSNYNTFSSKGRLWVDAVRKCLQMALVPLMRDYTTYTCADVKSYAFNSHAPCYLKPGSGAPSFCQLPREDYWRVFWTIKGAFGSAFSNSMYGMFEVSKGCLPVWSNQLGSYIQQLKIRLQLPASRNKRDVMSVSEAEHRAGFTLRRSNRPHISLSDKYLLTDSDLRPRRIFKRQAMNDTSNWQGESTANLYFHNLAGTTADTMAKQLNWNATGVTWFAYGQAGDSGTLNVFILLADRVAYDSNYNSLSPRPNMTDVVMQAGQAFENGDITIELEGRVVQPYTLDACSDVECQQVFLNVSAPLILGQETNHAMSRKIMLFHVLVSIFFAIML